MINDFKRDFGCHYQNIIGKYLVYLWIDDNSYNIEGCRRFEITIMKDGKILNYEQLRELGIRYKICVCYHGMHIPREEIEEVLKILSGTIVGNF